jgi:predicted PurR-regulated permease PerM
VSERSSTPDWDITRIVLAVVALLGLIVTCLWLLRPFLPPLVWGTMIVVATWPAMQAVQARLWGSRALAVTVMTLLILVAVVGPLATAVVAIVTNLDQIVGAVRTVVELATSAPPAWVRDLPFVGPRVAEEWARLASTAPSEVTAEAAPYLSSLLLWSIGQVGGLGALFIQFFLTLVVAAILYAHGETAADGMLAFMRRLIGEDGERVVLLSGQAIRAVALGVVVTAVVQSAVGGVGLLVCGVPYPALLTAVMLLLGLAQVGPTPLLVGVVIWLYWSGDATYGTVMLVWTLFTTMLDNFLRPFLIRRGADLPLLLIFAGVLGGLLAFGVIGLFVGPVMFAVAYTLLTAWVGWPNTPAAPKPLGETPAPTSSE